jgi:hypothetical protein
MNTKINPSPRIQAFRKEIIEELPRVPLNKGSLASLHLMPTNRLIQAYLTWKMRLVVPKPRVVKFWVDGVSNSEVRYLKSKLLPFLQKVAAGKDLSSHLSQHAKKAGIVLEGASPSNRRKDIDSVLIRQGLHHFHIGSSSPKNPKGRSDFLIFAEVLEKEFLVVAIASHDAFKAGSKEQLRFLKICNSYIAKDVPIGQGFLANPVMSSGHSMTLTLFSDACSREIEQRDPSLDDPIFINELYGGQLIMRDGKIIGKPEKSLMAWSFQDLKFGILDKKTKVFFCIYPFFSR